MLQLLQLCHNVILDYHCKQWPVRQIANINDYTVYINNNMYLPSPTVDGNPTFFPPFLNKQVHNTYP